MKITHRDFTLVIGIMVAIIIAITLIINHFQLSIAQGKSTSGELIPQLLTSLIESDLLITF